MPLAFEEVGPDPKTKKDAKPKERLTAPRRSAGPPPLHLDTQVVPSLVRKVGDWKTGRMSQAMCEAYLDRHTLVFDRELLGKMFAEADYQKQGSLDTRALTIAISGRFPKRELTAEWRRLTAMLLGMQELVLIEDDGCSLRATNERPPGGGTYNSGNIWDSPPPALPPVRRRTGSGRSSAGRVTASEPSPEWQGTMGRTAAAAAAGETGTGSLMGTGTVGSLGATLRSGSAGGALDSYGGGAGGLSGLVATTGGLKQVAQTADEARINAALGAGASTFAAAADFHTLARGMELAPHLAADSGGASIGPGSAADGAAGTGRVAARLGSPKSSVRVWAATLPPSAICLTPSALGSLRESVRSTVNSKPDFVRAVRPLDSCDLDQKKVLGQQMDVSASLARVEPVRDTKVLPRADYVAWSDYAAGCRTAPAGWDSGHPAAAAQDAGGHRYPWC